MRRFLPLFLLYAASALAESGATSPAGLQPIPEPPPPPPGYEPDPALEPQVTIQQRGEDKIEEYRVRGKLYMIKVTPPHGVSYYLIDEQGTGNFIRQGEVSPRLMVPMWILKTF